MSWCLKFAEFRIIVAVDPICKYPVDETRFAKWCDCENDLRFNHYSEPISNNPANAFQSIIFPARKIVDNNELKPLSKRFLSKVVSMLSDGMKDNLVLFLKGIIHKDLIIMMRFLSHVSEEQGWNSLNASMKRRCSVNFLLDCFFFRLWKLRTETGADVKVTLTVPLKRQGEIRAKNTIKTKS